MASMPLGDPIPLPAPVGLLEGLSLLTTTFHFLVVHILLGGLAVALVWYAVSPPRSPRRDAAGAVVTRLPILMTYVINFGVPPLLFLQVLYGPAVYASSVLIGARWISAIAMLMVGYGSLYWVAHKAKRREAWGLPALVSLVLFLGVGHLLVHLIALMNRPEVWPAMYRASALGTQLPGDDPVIWPRLFYMGAASLTGAAVAGSLLALRQTLSEATREILDSSSVRLLGLGVVLQIATGLHAFQAHPEVMQAALSGSPGNVAQGLWGASLVALLALTVVGFLGPWSGWTRLGIAGLFGINVGAFTVLRHLARNAALVAVGMDVSRRPVEANYFVVTLFVVCLVLALVAVAGLARVTAGADPVEEPYV